jgi:DNA mismatch repair protein MSH3
METLQAEANQAYIGFLAQMTENHYAELRDAINKLAVADCLLSLALVAQAGYVKPEFSDENVFEVVEGRHPMLEELHSDPFVPNDCHMGAGQPSSKIITGTSHCQWS